MIIHMPEPYEATIRYYFTTGSESGLLAVRYNREFDESIILGKKLLEARNAVLSKYPLLKGIFINLTREGALSGEMEYQVQIVGHTMIYKEFENAAREFTQAAGLPSRIERHNIQDGGALEKIIQEQGFRLGAAGVVENITI